MVYVNNFSRSRDFPSLDTFLKMPFSLLTQTKFYSSGLRNSNFIQFTTFTPTHASETCLKISFTFRLPEHFYVTFIHFNDRHQMWENKFLFSVDDDFFFAGRLKRNAFEWTNFLFSYDHFFSAARPLRKQIQIQHGMEAKASSFTRNARLMVLRQSNFVSLH